MNNKLKTQAVEQLFQAILSLKDLDEAYDFFEDVCTINEIYPYPRDLRLPRC